MVGLLDRKSDTRGEVEATTTTTAVVVAARVLRKTRINARVSRVRWYAQ